MKRFVMLAALGGAVTAIDLDARVAYAQPADALGKPLPDGALPQGTVAVRIVAGAPNQPVVGTEVTLFVNGEPRQARTDSAGRATFPSVPARAQVRATVLDAQSKEVGSETFPVPPSGGVRVMLTTKPFVGTAGPMMGHAPKGGQAMPEARQMSGQPRPDRSVAPGSYQVRVTYNSLEIKDGEAHDPEPPVGETVHVVGYRYDEAVSVQTTKVDAKGHAQFDGLDVSGETVYFALTRLPRNGKMDRLAAVPVQPETQAGAKLILSSDKRTSTTPPIDDLAGPRDDAMPEPNQVRVTLDGYPRELSEITLVDAVSKQVVAKGKPSVPPPDPSRVEGGSQFEADPALPKGTLDIIVHGGEGTADRPLQNVALKAVPVDATDASQAIASATDANGRVRIAVAQPDKKHRVLLTVNGKELASTELDLSTSGGKLDVIARWEAQGTPQIVFDVPYNPAHVLYAETRQIGPLSNELELYRSMPFLPVETAGAAISISVLPRVLFTFQLQAFVEDEILGVRGLWRVSNNSWIPYRATSDGLLVRLPKGHVGGVVGDEFQSEVSVAQGEGFRVLRALPPGPTQFEAGFSMKGDDGVVRWHFDLPLGAFQSMIQIRHFEGLDVQLPQGVHGSLQTGRSGSQWFTVENIMIPTKRSMVMTIRGLPSHPAWKKWVPYSVGIVVVLLLVAGIVYALIGKKTDEQQKTARKKQALMDELVELEKQGSADPKRREQVLAELERIWE